MNFTTNFKIAVVLAGLLSALGRAADGFVLDAHQVDDFIDQMVVKHHFDADYLRGAFASASGHKRILEVMAKPAEAKPWYEYRSIFLTAKRIEGGVKFWRANADTLRRVEAVYGVAPEIIVAIIGIETFYGRNTGSYRVLDAVATLAFHYPKRAAFFRSELEQFLLLTREENVAPLSLTGSYAGAMGIPQFISSSYRRYAVDFDQDGRRNIWSDVEDVTGSVANYLHAHGWQTGEPVAAPAESDVDGTALNDPSLKPRRSVAELSRLGIIPVRPVDAGLHAAVISLAQKDHNELWLGFNNFYVITRYNHSRLYAMAVFQLANEIKNLHQDQDV